MLRIVDHPLTLDEYVALPDDGNRYEVVDGQPVVIAAPVNPHQRACLRLARLLDDACPAGHEALVSPIDWVLWEVPTLHIRQPDVAVVSSRQADAARVTEPPLLVVEILSPDTFERDVIAKRAAYAQAGARHYWIVDLDVPEVVLYGSAEGRFVETARVTADERLDVSEPFAVTVRPADLVGPRPA